MRALYGKGTALTHKKAVQRKAPCKLAGAKRMVALIGVAKEKRAKRERKPTAGIKPGYSTGISMQTCRDREKVLA